MTDDNLPITLTRPLTAPERTHVQNAVAEWFLSGMFGDGLERMYIHDGIEFKGLNNYTDAELVQEFRNIVELDDPMDPQDQAILTLIKAG